MSRLSSDKEGWGRIMLPAAMEQQVLLRHSLLPLAREGTPATPALAEPAAVSVEARDKPAVKMELKESPKERSISLADRAAAALARIPLILVPLAAPVRAILGVFQARDPAFSAMGALTKAALAGAPRLTAWAALARLVPFLRRKAGTVKATELAAPAAQDSQRDRLLAAVMVQTGTFS